jgi:hypothetical protein
VRIVLFLPQSGGVPFTGKSTCESISKNRTAPEVSQGDFFVGGIFAG